MSSFLEDKKLRDAVEAVNDVPGGWQTLADYEPPRGFVFSSSSFPPAIKEIEKQLLRLDGAHSGASLADLFRKLQSIARGVDSHPQKIDKRAKFEDKQDHANLTLGTLSALATLSSSSSQVVSSAPDTVLELAQLSDRINRVRALMEECSKPTIPSPSKETLDAQRASFLALSNRMSFEEQMQELAKHKDTPITYAEMRARFG